MKINGIIIYLIGSIFCFASCDPVSNKIKVQNESASSIYTTYSADTLCPSLSENPVGYYKDNQILPKSMGSLTILGGDKDWEYFIDKCLNKKINVFVFSIDTIMKYGYTRASKERKYIKRYSYSKMGLDSIQWIIVHE
jgi:hypothetical protein